MAIFNSKLFVSLPEGKGSKITWVYSSLRKRGAEARERVVTQATSTHGGALRISGGMKDTPIAGWFIVENPSING